MKNDKPNIDDLFRNRLGDKGMKVNNPDLSFLNNKSFGQQVQGNSSWLGKAAQLIKAYKLTLIISSVLITSTVVILTQKTTENTKGNNIPLDDSFPKKETEIIKKDINQKKDSIFVVKQVDNRVIKKNEPAKTEIKTKDTTLLKKAAKQNTTKKTEPIIQTKNQVVEAEENEKEDILPEKKALETVKVDSTQIIEQKETTTKIELAKKEVQINTDSILPEAPKAEPIVTKKVTSDEDSAENENEKEKKKKVKRKVKKLR